MKIYNVGIAGYGGMGKGHTSWICKTDRINFCGVYDILPERMDVALNDGLQKKYASFADMLADDTIDIVLVATPNNFHMELVCEALRAGKAVVCEKPVAMNSAELQTMMDTAKQTGKLFTVHQNRRRDADYLQMREIVQSGQLGKVFQIESRVTGSRGIPEGWRQYLVAGGGMMLDWGVHLIDQIVMMHSGKVQSVYCEMYHVEYDECDDGFRLIMKLDNGSAAVVEVGTSHFISAPRWYVCGDRGALLIPDWNCNGKVVRATEHVVQWEDEIVQTKAGPTKTMAPRAKNTIEETELDGTDLKSDYDAFYRNLVEVLDGTAQPLVLPEQAMRVMKIMEAAFESHRTNAVINGPF